MRNLCELDRFRRRDGEVIKMWGWVGDETCGAFLIPSPVDRKPLTVIASSGEGWDHVSVSRPTRCPNWPEMTYIAKTFFNEGECAMQLHVPSSDHVNNHPYCLHWWRPLDAGIPLPPSLLVGLAHLGVLTPETAKRAADEVARLVAAKMASGT